MKSTYLVLLATMGLITYVAAARPAAVEVSMSPIAGSVEPATAEDTFSVTAPGSFYAIKSAKQGDLGQNPSLTLVRGKTYFFKVDAPSFHPFELTLDENGANPLKKGITNNNISKGTITLTVPMDAPDSLFYFCSIHFFGGTIRITN